MRRFISVKSSNSFFKRVVRFMEPTGELFFHFDDLNDNGLPIYSSDSFKEESPPIYDSDFSDDIDNEEETQVSNTT